MTTQPTYAEYLLQAGLRGAQWRSTITGQLVPACIQARAEANTPLNEAEAAAFEFIAHNPELLELVIRYAEEAMDARINRMSIRLVIERARWELAVVIRPTDRTYEINDHVIPYIARLANSIMGRAFFTARATFGEPGFAARDEGRSRRQAAA